MQTALKINATVNSDGKIEISTPELLPGDTVEIIILLPEESPVNGNTQTNSALDILRRTEGQRQFKTAGQVETYLHRERASWDD